MFRYDRLAALREEQQLSQAELGALANISAKTIWRWENGNRIPQAEHLARLARALRCSIDYLMGLVDEPRGLYSGGKLTVAEQRVLLAYDRMDEQVYVELLTDRIAQQAPQRIEMLLQEELRRALHEGLLTLPPEDDGE